MTKIFYDRRPKESIELIESKDVTYIQIEVTNPNFKNSKVNKDIIKKEIKERLSEYKNKQNLTVRYSGNYDKSSKSWRSWHSVDFKLNENCKNLNSIVINDIELTNLSYAFITKVSQNFQTLVFSTEEFAKLLQKKIEKDSYTIYQNSQQKYFVKFNFYFSGILQPKENEASSDKISITSNVTVKPNKNIHPAQRLINKIRSKVQDLFKK
ncbi:hypothetical protein HPA12_05835 [Streptococcus suis]|nr:hypothetical protein [Streptococcus suis]